MSLCLKMAKNRYLSFLLMISVYVVALLISITIANRTSLVDFKIEPYISGSNSVDFFLPLIVTAPFTWEIYYMKKDNFLNTLGCRISITGYVSRYIISSTIFCLFAVFIANLIAGFFSISIADLSTHTYGDNLKGEILGNLQMYKPYQFIVIWSLYKSIIITLICFFGQTVALHMKNIFLTVITPFIIILLENFVTSNLKIPEYSLITTFVLNRLDPMIMSVPKLAIPISILVITMTVLYIHWKKNYEKYC